MLLFLPETSLPRARGIDKAEEALDGRFSWLRNPFAHIPIFRSPNVVAVVSPCFEYIDVWKLLCDLFLPLGYHRRSLFPNSAWREPSQ